MAGWPRLAAMRRMPGLGAGAAEPVAVEGGDGGFPVDPGVGVAVVAGASVDVAGDEVGPGQPGVVGGDQLGGGGVAGEAASGMADQGCGQVAVAGAGRTMVVHLGGGGAGGGLVGDGLARRVGGDQRGDGKPGGRPRVAAGGVVDERGGVVAEQHVGAAGERV